MSFARSIRRSFRRQKADADLDKDGTEHSGELIDRAPGNYAKVNAMPSVDIAITSYQYARFLRQSSYSVLSQDFTNLRLLIIDNASTDGSREVAQQIAASDKRVTLMLNEENRGFIHSFNRAIDWAAGNYLVILDADDLLAPGSLSASVKFLEKNPDVAFAYGIEGRLIDGLLDPARCGAKHSRWQVTDGHAFIRRTCWDSFCDIGAPAIVRRTSAQKKAGYYRSDLPRTCDFEMYLRLGLVGSVARHEPNAGHSSLAWSAALRALQRPTRARSSGARSGVQLVLRT